MREKRPASLLADAELEFTLRDKGPGFAEKMTEGALAVVLEPDVAGVFRSSEDTLLRSVIAAMR